MRSTRRGVSLIACGLALRAATAAGQTLPAAPEPWPAATPPAPVAPAPSAERWYGWQTLLADAGAVTLTIALAANVDDRDDSAVVGAAVLGASAFVLAGPIVHAAHGHWAKAGESLALRLGLSLVGGAIGWGVGACSQYTYDHDGCAIGYAAAGGIVGAAMAVIADAVILGREPIAAPPRPLPTVAFTPLRDGGGLSLGGRF